MDDFGEQVERTRLDLAGRYGELIGGDNLRLVLGYQSNAALSQAIRGKKLALVTFFVPGRKGRFALTRDIAEWLIKQRESAT